MKTQWWKNPDALSSEELYSKLDDCTARANRHDEEDRPILAQAARSKATIAGEALNRKGMKLTQPSAGSVPYVEVNTETAYGRTSRMSRSIRVF